MPIIITKKILTKICIALIVTKSFAADSICNDREGMQNSLKQVAFKIGYDVSLELSLIRISKQKNIPWIIQYECNDGVLNATGYSKYEDKIRPINDRVISIYRSAILQEYSPSTFDYTNHTKPIELDKRLKYVFVALAPYGWPVYSHSSGLPSKGQTIFKTMVMATTEFGGIYLIVGRDGNGWKGLGVLSMLLSRVLAASIASDDIDENKRMVSSGYWIPVK